MARRYLEVDVARQEITTVRISVDDECPEWNEALSDRCAFDAWGMLEPHLAGAVTREDWDASEPEPFVEAVKVREIPEEEARLYRVYEVPGPSPAEVRAAREAAGQLALGVA